MAQVSITSSDVAVDASKGKTKLLKLSGQLDETNIETESQKVYTILEQEKPKNIIFDVTELSYLNSKSIGYFADWQQKVTGEGGKLVMFGAQQNIFDILDVVGLTNLIPLVKTLDEAIGAL